MMKKPRRMPAQTILTCNGCCGENVRDISSLDSLFDEASSGTTCCSQHLYWQSEARGGNHVTRLVGWLPD